jgi:hypothetical protein
MFGCQTFFHFFFTFFRFFFRLRKLLTINDLRGAAAPRPATC